VPALLEINFILSKINDQTTLNLKNAKN